MKFKTGCALAVLTLMCFQSSHGGILKKWFSKDGANVLEQDKKEEADNNTSSDSKENNISQENQENNNAGTSSETEKTTSETKPEEKVAEVPATPVKSGDSNPIIAKVGNKSIRLNEITEIIKELPPELLQRLPADKLYPVMRKQLVDNMLLLDHAARVGIEKRPEFIQQLEQAKKQLLLRFVLMMEIAPILQNKARLDSEYTAYLVGFKKDKEYSIHFALFKEKKEAEAMIEALKKGGEFTKLMAEKTIASTAGLGTEDKFIPVHLMPEFMQNALKELKKNEYSKTPVETKDGYYVFKVVSIRDSKPLPRDKADNVLQERIMRGETQKLMDRLYKQTNVKLFKEDGSPDTAASPAA